MLPIAILSSFGLLFVGYAVYQIQIVNPRVTSELRDNPGSPAAERAMLLTLSDGKVIPVNYLREGDQVFVGADGSWWRAFQGSGARVGMLIQGAELAGHACAVLDDPDYTKSVFSRLRPATPKWLPDWLNGVLVVINTRTDTSENCRGLGDHVQVR